MDIRHWVPLSVWHSRAAYRECVPKPRTTMPRGFLKRPDLFGRASSLDWVQPSSPDEYAGLRAAELQHHFSVELVARLEEAGQSKSWLESQAGLAAGRLSKIIRGHAQLSLRDVAAVEGVLGPIIGKLEYSHVAVRSADLRSRFAKGAR